MKLLILATVITSTTFTALPSSKNLEMSIGTGSSGIVYSDQWGNPWMEVMTPADGKKAIVSIFDCAGVRRAIGEVPMPRPADMASNFTGFKPYLNATMRDLAAVSNQASFERNCLEQSRQRQACEPAPKRYDCKVVLEPANGGNSIPADAWKAYEAMHPRNPK